MTSTPLSLTARTLYAELLEHALVLGLRERGVVTGGTFTTKDVSNRRHVYFQFREMGQKTRQAYVGPDTPETWAMVDALKARERDHEAELVSLNQTLRAFIGAGGWTMDHASFRIVKGFADAGLFSAGQGLAVLIGTLAFNILGNVLGVSWESNMRTEDIDFAAERHIAIGVPRPTTPAPSVIDNLQMGFVPVPQFGNKTPETSFKVRGKALRIDLLTPGKLGETTMTQAFGSNAQCLPYLDFLLKESIPAVAFDRKESRVVAVPAPARFTVHKLLVSENREPFMQSKAKKDREQASQMIRHFLEEDPHSLAEALEEACNRGANWSKRIQAALQKLDLADLMPGNE